MYQAFASPIGDSFWDIRRGLVALGTLLLAFGLVLFAAGDALAHVPAAAPDVIAVADLPAEARATMDLVRKGGPFPYSRDGIVFYNREGRLPKMPRGTYREYTVKTPGSRDRGARRIVHSARGEFYYTADHYRSFRRILE